ncbi:MAG: 2-C-methyl-D-erythritol 4-phosphate cytidylyltransferase [Proteobacteria bacterium]|nr:2-C-methyl-D-erythritol 4-phosphate cytidylyltransferase [Pseudomonadota bacterium]
MTAPVHPLVASLFSLVERAHLRLLPPVAGGASRQESVCAGLEALAETAPDLDLVLIHEAARPFVDEALIDRVIDGLAAHAGALPCLPVTDTLKRVREGRVIIVGIDVIEGCCALTYSVELSLAPVVSQLVQQHLTDLSTHPCAY